MYTNDSTLLNTPKFTLLLILKKTLVYTLTSTQPNTANSTLLYTRHGKCTEQAERCSGKFLGLSKFLI